MIGVFLARDAIVFYTAYEFTLVPMYFLIAIYGGAERRAASVKFFLYTFLGSILTLSGVIYIAVQCAKASGGQWSFDLATLAAFASTQLSNTEQYWVFILLMVGFAVKVPFFPVHTWLPLAHDQAPTAGSVILAGTLLKLGTYGVYRIALPSALAAAARRADARGRASPCRLGVCVTKGHAAQHASSRPGTRRRSSANPPIRLRSSASSQPRIHALDRRAFRDADSYSRLTARIAAAGSSSTCTSGPWN